MSRQPLLFGLSHIERSVELMREFEPPEGYVLAFSGGKDSQALLEVAHIAGVQFRAEYRATGIDPPELVRFIKQHYPEVVFLRPHRENWWQGLGRHGLPLRAVRWCCRSLKEEGGNGAVVLTGIRAEESARRAKRGAVTWCARQSKHLISPLFSWTEQQAWDFLVERGKPHCSLYDEGRKRLGCVPCPFEGPLATQESLRRWPRIFEATKRCARVYWDRQNRAGPHTRFANFDAYWEWWLARRLPWPETIGEESQPSLFCRDDADANTQPAAG
jgi:phosphoadenosine phosphosulfate reductase